MQRNEGIEKQGEQASPPGVSTRAVAAASEPLPLEHLHPDLQDRLLWLVSFGAALGELALARLSGVPVERLAQEKATLLRSDWLEETPGAWTLRATPRFPREQIIERTSRVVSELEARYREEPDVEIGERIFDVYLREDRQERVAFATSLAALYLRDGKAEDARTVTERVLGPAEACGRGVVSDVSPAREAWRALRVVSARALRENGSLEAALTALVDVEGAEAEFERAQLDLTRGELGAALARLDALDSPEASLLGAEALYEAGEIARARAGLERHEGAPDLDAEHAARRSNLLGKVWLSLGEDAKAMDVFDSLSRSTLPLWRARAFHNMALVFLSRDDHRRSIDLWQKTHVLAAEAGQPYGASLALYNIGVAYEYLGNYSVSLKYLAESLVRFRAGGYRQDFAMALTALADVYITLGRLRGARAVLRAADRLAGTLGLALQGQRVALRSARVDLELGHVEAALDRLADARRFFEETGGVRDLSETLVLQAEARARQGGGSELKDSLASALKRHEADARTGADSELRGLLTLHSGLLRRDIATAERGFTLLSKPGNPWSAFRAAGAIADLHATRQDREQERWRALAESWLQRFKKRVPEAFARGLDQRPDISRHRNAFALSVCRDQGRLDRRVRSLSRAEYPEVLGQSARFVRALAQIEELAALEPASVLLDGASGSGRETLARVLHAVSPRRGRPFVAIAPDDKGAASWNVETLRRADGGVLFIDGVDAMAVDEQRALLCELRLDLGETRRGRRSRGLDLRVVCARAAVEAPRAPGHDLLLRELSPVYVTVPGLDERRGDIPALASGYLATLAREHRSPRSFSAEELADLKACPWPGNLRELRDEVARRFWAPGSGSSPLGASGPALVDPFPLDLGEMKTEMEVRVIREALVRSDANIAAAARLIGMKRPRLSQKIRELNIDIELIRRTL